MSGYQGVRSATTGQRLKFLFKDSVLYGGVAAFGRLLSLITVPVLTRVFSPAEYGTVDAIAVFGSLFVALIIMGQDSALVRFFYDTEDPIEKNHIISQALITEIVLCFVVTLVVWLTSDFWVSRVIVAPNRVSEFRTMVTCYPFLMLFQFCQNLSKWTFARRQFIILSLGSSVFVVVLTMFFVVKLGFGVAGVFYSQLIGMVLFSMIGLFLHKSHFVWPRKFNYCWKMIQIGWPYMLVAVISTMIPALDRVFITQYLGLEAMGFYAIGYKIAALMSLPINAFQMAWGPFSLAIYKEANAKETYDKVLLYYVAVISLLGFCLVAVAEPVIKIMATSRYIEGQVVVLPLVSALIVESTAWIIGLGVFFSKKTYGIALSYSLGLAGAAFLIWILIKPLGIQGVAVGFMLGRLIQGITYTFLAYRLYPLRFDLRIPCFVFLGTLLCASSLHLFTINDLVYNLLLRILFTLLLALTIWRFAFPCEERAVILRKGGDFLRAIRF